MIDRVPSSRRATLLAAAGLVVSASLPALACEPALAIDARPYVRVGGEAAYESNVTGRFTTAEEPLSSFYGKGQADFIGLGSLDAGADVDLGDRFSLFGGLGAKGIGYANYPVFSHVSGSGTLEVTAVDLPGDLDASLGYGNRGDFQGWHGQWAAATLERPLPWALAGHLSAGYDWSTAIDPRAARQGPFVDLGFRRRFRSTGTSVRATLGASRPTYGSGRLDTAVTASLGLSQRLAPGIYATLRARFDLIDSTEPNRTYSAPALAIGTAWILP